MLFSLFFQDPAAAQSAVETVLYVVGSAVGAPAHIAPVVGGVIVGGAALCGTAVSLVGAKLLWVGQVGCKSCRRELAERTPSVEEWADE